MLTAMSPAMLEAKMKDAYARQLEIRMATKLGQGHARISAAPVRNLINHKRTKLSPDQKGALASIICNSV